MFPDSETVSTKAFFANPYTSRERVQNERRNGLFRELAPKGASMRNYPAEHILSAADEMNASPRKKLNHATPEELFDLFGYTQRIANPSEPVKDKRLRLACRSLDNSGRACCGGSQVRLAPDRLCSWGRPTCTCNLRPEYIPETRRPTSFLLGSTSSFSSSKAPRNKQKQEAHPAGFLRQDVLPCFIFAKSGV